MDYHLIDEVGASGLRDRLALRSFLISVCFLNLKTYRN